MAKVEITVEYCKACELCINACPKGCPQIGTTTNKAGDDVVEMKPDAECVACKMCAVMCPEAAIEVYK